MLLLSDQLVDSLYAACGMNIGTIKQRDTLFLALNSYEASVEVLKKLPASRTALGEPKVRSARVKIDEAVLPLVSTGAYIYEDLFQKLQAEAKGFGIGD